MQDTNATYFGNRESGIPLIGDLPWGSHFCQFYQDQADLLEILVPYVQTGLQNNELCLWVVDGPQDVEEAGQALKKAVPRFEEYAQQGQVEILSRDQWRSCDGQIVSAVVSRLDQAIAHGFDGLRLVCHALPEEALGPGARDTADALCRYNVIAAFAYPRDRFDAVGLMAVVRNHRLALVKNAGRWEVIESSEAQSVKEALRRSEEKLHSVFANMSEGFAYHRIVLDARGDPCDFVFLEVNEAFGRLTGLKREDLIGRRATRALPGIEKDTADWIGTYGKVALTGKPAQFESYSELLRKWYSVSAFSPHKGFFAVTFSDITERKATEEAMREANERLQNQAEELQTQAEELHTQTEELNAQAAELRAVNDELQKSEQALRISEQRVRLKLDSILSPEGDFGNLELADIIDVQAIQSLMDEFYALARIPMSIIDLKGRVLVGVGWQEICARFHRVHPQACKNCFESDTQLTAGIAPGECRLYKCKNNMWDIATPLMVAGHHVGHLFSGQFFFEDEPLDRELFRSQARGYGFNEQGYLAALEAVPRLSREAVTKGMAFLMKLARMLSRLSYSNIELARSLGERERLMESLHRSRDRLNRAQEIAHLGSWELDLTCNELTWSDEVYRIFGLEPQEFGATYEAFLEHVHPEDRAAVDAAYVGSLRENRDSYEIDHRVVRKDTGEIRIVHEKCEHFRNAAGQVIRSVGMVHDITERKRAEESLRASEARLRLAQDAAHAGTWEWDLQTNQNYWSEELWKLYGLEPCCCEPSYEAWLQTVLPEDRSRVAQSVQEAARRETVLNAEWRVRDRQGRERWLMSRGQPVRNARGRTTSYRGIVFDITDRKRAEEALRESERRFKLLSEVTARLLAAENPQAVIDDLCHAVMEYLGCECFFNFLVDPGEGRLHLNACAGIPESERAKLEWLDYGVAVCGCAARDATRIVAEHIPTTEDPRTELVKSYGVKACACHPILAGAEVLGTLSFGTRTREVFQEKELSLMKTVTDLVAIAVQRQRSEQALREGEQRLRLALEGGGMGRWEWDVQRDSTLWDERVHELLGLAPQVPAASRLFFDVIDRRDKNAVRQLVDKALAGGEDLHAEFRVRRLHGETPWLVSQGKVIRDEQGQAVRMMGVIYDITQRKQMEADLRRLNDQLEEEVQTQTEELKDTVDRLQEEVGRRTLVEETLRRRSQMLEAFFQHTITPLAFMDRHFNFVRVNAAYARADGKEPESFAGRNHFDLYPHDVNRPIFEQVLQTKQPYFAFAKPFTFPDTPQRITYWNWLLTPLLNERGEVQFLVLNLEDVTERQQAFQELEQRARQLQKLTLELSQAEDRERKRLSEILHDDLQQQLAAAKFHLSLLGKRVPKDTAIQGAVAQLDRILKDAIEKSRSLSHELSPAVLYQSDLGETFEWLARQLKTKHGLMVHVESRGHIDSPSEALKVLLFKTAREILFNVVKHARVREARLRIQRLRGSLWLTISDQGQGFDPRSLGKTGGFGLLSIRERIELLGGRMKIRSAPGRGSTFLITVPDGEEETMAARAEGRKFGGLSAPAEVLASAPSLAGGARLRVLLVDDHKVMREGLAALLNEQSDLTVVGQAGNGREAVDLAYRLHPDVVVIDVAMPLMSGDEATRQIKLQWPRARVVALSMFEEADMAEAMRQAGAEMYLLKTAPSDELLAAIRGR